MVFVAAVVLAVLFLAASIFYSGKLKSAKKNETQEIKQKINLYRFGVVFAIAIGIFAKTQGI